MRKEAGFEVMDRIVVSYESDEKIAGIFAANKDEIMHEVLADEIRRGALEGYEKSWNINGEEVKLGVKKQ